MPDSLSSLLQQRDAIFREILSLGLSQRFHHHYWRQMRQAELSLSPSRQSGTWTELPSNSQTRRQDDNRNLFLAS